MELRQEPACLCPTMDAKGELTFRLRSPGARHYLDDQGIHAGDILEMQIDDGTWQCVRYEYTWDPNTQILEAFLHFEEDRCLRLPTNACFRWPAA